MLLGWWGLIPFKPSSDAFYIISASVGFITGVLLDATLLRRFMMRLFSLPLPALCALLAFYSILLFGFFMGFPTFNILPGILGGYIAAKATAFRERDSSISRRFSRRMDAFSFIFLLLICVCTAILTLREPTIQFQLKSMLSLPFDVTYQMIWVAILIGGAVLLALQYTFSRLIQRHVLTKSNILTSTHP
jgi:putative flippase GtrA